MGAESLILGALIGYALGPLVIAAWELRDEILDRIVPSRRRARREEVDERRNAVLTRYAEETARARRELREMRRRSWH